MRCTFISRAIAAALAISLGTYTSMAIGEEPPSREATLTVQSDGTHCIVDKTTLLCSEVVSHLREVLKLPAKSRIHLQVGNGAPYESVMKVVDMLNKSEYPSPVGYLAPEYPEE
jgi:biopolymer transport protein ExbD